MLPIQAVYDQLLSQLTTQPRVLLQAPPGAGKSTWLPLQLMLDGHFKRIIMLEPRRLAARNIARFLAAQLNEAVGERVGLRIRQEVKVSARTQLEIVTEGTLTRLLQADPELEGVDLLIFDEFHERSLAADTALAFALESQQALRDDLHILVMSATLDSERYQQFLDCPAVRSDGRSFPIDEVYIPLKDESRWLEQIPPIVRQALSEQSGSVLVFLPGQKEIRYVSDALQNTIASDPQLLLATLSGEQDKQTQQAAIAPAPKGMRKVVLTTNVAETSLTIEGIRVVVDSGKRRAAHYNLRTGVSELVTQSISRSSAVQRAGRAGRIEAGVVYRLGSKALFERRDGYDRPDILCSDLSGLMLEAKVWGSEIHELALLDMPTDAQLAKANELLNALELIDIRGRVTPLGKQVQSLGADPRFGHMLLKSQELEAEYPGIVQLGCYFVALLESRVSASAELSVALQQQATRPHPVFRQQLLFWLRRAQLQHTSDELAIEHLPLVVALAFPDRLAKRRGQGWVLANGAGVSAHKEYWQDADYLAIADLGGHKGLQIFSATAFEPKHVQNALPHLFRERDVCEFEQKSGQFVHEQRLYLGHWIYTAKPAPGPIDTELRTEAWLTLVRQQGLPIFKDYADCEGLLTRMTLAQALYPQEFQAIDEASLLAKVEVWLAPYLSDVKQLPQLKKLDLHAALLSNLEWAQQQRLNALLPQRITVPSGSNIRIHYQLDGPARLSVRMQEVYGMSHSPILCEGRLPVLMELLSPAQRPLQLTQDLAHFWQSSYREVQKEMKGRYPKHFWPDDPATAQATNRVKSRM
ncbi:ATP-dependent helicase HrpB [Pseudoalteromonas rubra]|uniref:ATP-dependent helicase HrpB n=1 Tax=Pseudoalteromonas rubra TaxID=43658 RepID=A0A5S3WPG2_9GAMM|nr:ATP-dependent helicase HrpB [Pseudoalteromonas rubra]TMP30441.1 ATP-dependent helicase HrpB [Pseudoalteromonas rubra]TMP35464.1 ATP-dependent helicase HrpB [Pseudoalteromonas rubra]